MESLMLFTLQILIPILLGWLVSTYLENVTRRLLNDLCGTPDRSEFWVRINRVLSIATPTALVVLFGGFSQTIALGELLRQTLSISLLGIVVSVMVLAWAIWRTIPQQHQTVTGNAKHPLDNVAAGQDQLAQ